jgi:hypothetical protein
MSTLNSRLPLELNTVKALQQKIRHFLHTVRDVEETLEILLSIVACLVKCGRHLGDLIVNSK